jgi:hypothetical protein
VPWQWVRSAEMAFCREIIKNTVPTSVAKHAEDGIWSETNVTRYYWIGGGAVAGGVLLAVTGSLAAPALVAGLGLAGAAVAGAGFIGAGAASFAAAVAGFGGLSMAMGAGFGAAGAGLVGFKMARRTGSLQEFEFDLIDCSPGLPVTIGVHGWLDKTTSTSAWSVWDSVFGDESHHVGDGGEIYALRWESTELKVLGLGLGRLVESTIQSQIFSAGGTAVLGAAYAAAALPMAALTSLDYVDNCWSVVQQRADKAGELLAEALLLRLHGNRAVTLVGYGHGARMILKCLLILADAKDGHGYGIVETALLVDILKSHLYVHFIQER